MSNLPRFFRAYFNNFHPVRAVMTLFIFTFLFFSNSFSLWGQSLPDYTWLRKVDLPTVSGSSLNTEDITIAIAQDRNGNIYTLSVGSGIDKRDVDGNLLQKGFIPGSAFDSPRDLAIDDDGFIYVADYLASGDTFTDDGKIRVFDPSGNYLSQNTILTSFYRPLGIDISGDRIFVAEYYDGLQGPEQGSTFSRVRIYDKTTKALLDETKNVDIPLRIAVNSKNDVYVSQAGAGNPGVLIFDTYLDPTGQLPNITSPGSVIVDEVDYIHVIEYGNRLKFNEFIGFDNLDMFEITSLAEDISAGVKNEEFFLKIFNPDGTYGGNLLTQLDFPVDVAQQGCGSLFIDNAEIFDGSFWGLYFPSKLEFDLEVYQRTPSIDAAEAPQIGCPGNKEFTFDPAAGFVVPDFMAEAEASDNCGYELVQDPQPGTRIYTGQTIIITATDTSGNEASCEFELILNEEVAEVVEITSCPASQILEVGAACETVLPDLRSQVQTNITAEIVQEPAPGTVLSEDTVVRFTVTDADGNADFCEITVIVEDDQAPQISCTGNKEFSFDPTAGFVVPDFKTEAEASDNCAFELVQDPQPGTRIYTGQTITITATDTFGNEALCDFELVLNEEVAEVVGITSCPASQVLELGTGCGVTLPDLRSQVQTNIAAEIVQEPAPGTVLSEDTVVRFTATDADGKSDFCEMTVTLRDNQFPQINCPGNKEFSFDPAAGFVVPDFKTEAEASDNCAVELVQDPQPGVKIFTGQSIVITATDTSGNEAFCEFELILNEEISEVVEITSCPASQALEVGSDCEAVLPDLRSQVQTNIAAEIVQEPAPGTVLSEDTVVRFTVTDADGNSDFCEMTVKLEDNQAPQISCTGNKEFSFDPAAGFVLPDFRAEAEASDNCTFELVQDPQPGTRIYKGQTITITATDTSGNEAFCEFELILNEEVAEGVEITSCPASQVLEVSTACEAVLPDLRSHVQTNIAAEIVQEPAPGTVLKEDTVVRFTATDADGNSDFCEMTIKLEDNQAPQIRCPGNKKFTFDPTAGFVVPDFMVEAEASDNCGYELVQDPQPGTRIYTGQTIIITATDTSGNEASCEFELILNEEVAEVVEITSCPASQAREVGAACDAVLPDLRNEVQTNIAAEIVQQPAPGTVIIEDTVVSFTATDADGNSDFCEMTIKLEDNQAPQISCTGNKEFSFDPAAGFVLPDFRAEAEASDNCTFELVQDPQPGTRIYTGQTITITATDTFGNEAFCDFEIILNEEVAEVVEITSCPASQALEVGADCEVVLPDLRNEVQTNLAAEIVQVPAPGTILSEDTVVRFTAKNADGNSDFCEMTVKLQDNHAPQISCPGNKEFTFDPAAGFVVPDFRSEAEASDNCGYELVQDPQPGTPIYTGQIITITATDSSGNEASCEFELILNEEVAEVVEITFCPASQALEIGADCEAVLPDLRSQVQTNITAEIVQEPAPGTVLSEDTVVRFTATDADGNSDFCEMTVKLEDNQVPQISCPGDIVTVWKPEEGYLLLDFTGKIVINENCGEFSIVQEPAPGTLLKAEQEINFTITGASGNAAFCSFWLYLSEEENLSISCPGEQVRDFSENCGYVMEDFSSLVDINSENTIVTQEPPPGTPISATTEVTMTAAINGQEKSCSFKLVLQDMESPQARCVGSYTLQLNEQGMAALSAEEIDNGSTDNCQIVSRTLSKNTFSEADIGEQKIILTVIDAHGNEDSCETTVIVEVPPNPEITCVEKITLELNENRRAKLDPRDLFTGGTGTIQFSVSKEEFTCADIGEQKILFSYTSPNQEGTCEILVTVEDLASYCQLIIDEPNDPGPYVIISPNPGYGLVEIFTSADISVHRAEVYDMRGRFLFARDFEKGTPHESPYSLDLRKYQSGVYTINLETDTGRFIRRAIIKND